MLEIYPVKAQYRTGELIALEIKNNIFRKEVVLVITQEENIIQSSKITLSDGITRLELGSFTSHFSGFGAEVRDTTGKLMGSTAFDVVKDSRQSLRYGFLSDFTKDEGKDLSDIQTLRKFHINLIQFYDWSYRHDQLVADTTEYIDMMGKKISGETVQKKIAAAHEYGMQTVAYGAVYAACESYYRKHPDWGLYTGSGKPFCFIDTFYIMNLQKDCPWHEHIVKEYQKAVREMDFDGIHMDTYGFPKTAFNEKRELVELKKEFASLINDTKKAVSKEKKNTCVIFNNVGNWPVTTVMDSAMDAVYIEVWKPQERYFQIQQIIRDAKVRNQAGRCIILAAYLAPFRLETEERGLYAALLLTAVIVTNGAYHLLLGEKNGVLTQGYYSDYSVLSGPASDHLRLYYDFMIRYLNLFYDETLLDVTMTHMGWDNYEYQFLFPDWSCYGEHGKIWVTVRESTQMKFISLINLCGNDEDYWNQGKDKPLKRKNLTFLVEIDALAVVVFMADPEKAGTPVKVPVSYETTDKGRFVRFTIDTLNIWKIIWIRNRDKEQ